MMFNMGPFFVQRSPNLCPEIYVVLYFVSPQIDRMYISRTNLPNAMTIQGQRSHISTPSPDAREPYMAATSYPLSLPGSFLLLSVLAVPAFFDEQEIVASVLVRAQRVPDTQ